MLFSCPAVTLRILCVRRNTSAGDSKMTDVIVLLFAGKVKIIRSGKMSDMLLHLIPYTGGTLPRTNEHDKLNGILGSRQNHENGKNRKEISIGPEICLRPKVHHKRHGIQKNHDDKLLLSLVSEIAVISFLDPAHEFPVPFQRQIRKDKASIHPSS